jgi:hypothetical protein
MGVLFTVAGSQYLNMGVNIPSLNNVGAATIMGWVYMTTLPPALPDPQNKYMLLGLSIGPGSDPRTDSSRMEIEIQNPSHFNGVSRLLDTDVFAQSVSTPDGQFVIGTPVHVAFTANYQTGAVKLYTNGRLVMEASIVWNGGLGNTSATNSACGAAGSEEGLQSEFTDGTYEDLRVYNRELTPDEILTIYNTQGIDGIVRGLQQRYELQDNATGKTTASSAPADSAIQGFNLSSSPSSPVFQPSIAPTYRRRLP